MSVKMENLMKNDAKLSLNIPKKKKKKKRIPKLFQIN